MKNKVDEYIRSKQMTHDFNRNDTVFSPHCFREGVEFIFNSPEVSAVIRELRDDCSCMGEDVKCRACIVLAEFENLRLTTTSSGGQK